MIKTYQYNTNLLDQIRTLSYEDTVLNTILKDQLMPRVILMEKIITFQLPSAIMKAFEVSHQDLRISLSNIMYDLKRVIELYKALMGFEDDWVLSNNAQKLQCSWSDLGHESETTADESMDTQEKINSTINSLDSLLKDNYSLIHELQLVFGGIFKTVTDYRRQFGLTGSNNSTNNVGLQIQSDYLLYLLSILNNSGSIHSFANQLKHSRLYLHTQYSKSSQARLENILSQVETTDWVFPILREFQIRRFRRSPKIFEEPIINNIQWDQSYRRNLDYFYSIRENYTTTPLYSSSHRINKRYVRPGIFRLPTYYYTRRKEQRVKDRDKGTGNSSTSYDSKYTIKNLDFPQVGGDTNEDQCKSYMLPGYKVYYCKDNDFTCELSLKPMK